jgi:hypothetical protein
MPRIEIKVKRCTPFEKFTNQLQALLIWQCLTRKCQRGLNNKMQLFLFTVQYIAKKKESSTEISYSFKGLVKTTIASVILLVAKYGKQNWNETCLFIFYDKCYSRMIYYAANNFRLSAATVSRLCN